MGTGNTSSTSNDDPTHAQGLEPTLENRHIQLIAIGGAIGTGLFMGSGKTIALSGSSILFTYMIIGFFLFFIMRALGELLLSNSSYNSFADFASEYLGEWTGFFIGWSYWLSWVIACIGDVVIVGGYLQYWFPSLQVWIPAFSCLLGLILLNILSVKLFGELEFWFSIIKILAILALIGTGFWMVFTGYTSPSGVHASINHLLNKDVLFPHGASGFLAGFQIAIFSFIGVELVGVTAKEAKNPEKTLPKAINSIPLRILFFYVLAISCIIMVNSWYQISATKSPFVELFTLAGLPAAAAVINFVVLTSALSSANSGVFSTSRMIFGLAHKNAAPKPLKKLSSANIPLRGLLLSGFCMFTGTLLLFIVPSIMSLFTLLSTLAAILLLFIWSIILLSYLKYRKTRHDLHQKSIYKMPMGIAMSYACLSFLAFILIILWFKEDTRIGLLIAPFWFLWLTIAYKNRTKLNNLIAKIYR